MRFWIACHRHSGSRPGIPSREGHSRVSFAQVPLSGGLRLTLTSFAGRNDRRACHCHSGSRPGIPPHEGHSRVSFVQIPLSGGLRLTLTSFAGRNDNDMLGRYLRLGDSGSCSLRSLPGMTARLGDCGSEVAMTDVSVTVIPDLRMGSDSASPRSSRNPVVGGTFARVVCAGTFVWGIAGLAHFVRKPQ
jgi:hypothetical protein